MCRCTLWNKYPRPQGMLPWCYLGNRKLNLWKKWPVACVLDRSPSLVNHDPEIFSVRASGLPSRTNSWHPLWCSLVILPSWSHGLLHLQCTLKVTSRISYTPLNPCLQLCLGRRQDRTSGKPMFMIPACNPCALVMTTLTAHYRDSRDIIKLRRRCFH